MALQSNLTSDIRRPVTAVTFDATSASRGLTPVNRRLAIVAMMTSSGDATADIPIRVGDESEARARFGEGSEAALMVSKALDTWRSVIRQRGGGPAQIWVAPLADPGGVAAVKAFLITGGPSTEAKDLIVRVAGRTIRASIASGTTKENAATELKNAIDAVDQDLPITASVAGVGVDEVHCTYRTSGVNGNDVALEVVQVPAGLSVATSAPVTGTGTPTLTTALANLLTRDYQAVAIANHASADVTALATHMDAAWLNTAKKFRHGFVGETGTLATATTLASTNREEICFHSIEGSPSLPCELAVSLAAMTLTIERPAYNYSRMRLPLFAPSEADAYIDSELETALAGGVTPSKVTDAGEVEMQRWVTSRTTNGGVLFESLLSGINSKTLYYYALQADNVAQQELEGNNVDDDLLERIRDRIFEEVLKGGERNGDLHNVDAHADELRVEAHPDLPHRILTEVPQSVVQEALQVDSTHRLFIETPGAA